MYVDEHMNGRVSVHYVSTHMGHELGPQELKYLLPPESTKEEVSVKISMGIPPERILKGNHTIHFLYMYMLRYYTYTVNADVHEDVGD